jgi:hypothetical protein
MEAVAELKGHVRVTIALTDLVEGAVRRGLSWAMGMCEVDCRRAPAPPRVVSAIGKG